MQSVSFLKREWPDYSIPETVECWRQWLREQDRSPKTIKSYIYAVAYFLDWYEQEEQTPLQLATLTPIALIGYRNELQHEQHKSVSTINQRLSALRDWCGWLVDQGYLLQNPAARLKHVGGDAGSKREGLSSTQVNALLHQAQLSRDPARNYAIIQVLLQTGIRLSECSGIAYSDIISFGEQGGMLRIRAEKGNKERLVPLNTSASEALALYVGPLLGIEGPSINAVAAEWSKSTASRSFLPLFISQKGGYQLTTSAMGQMIADLVRGARDLVPEETNSHTLRHTFARSYLAQYPENLVGLANLLGHRSLKTTELYNQRL